MKRFSFYKLAGLVMPALLLTFTFGACKKQASNIATLGAREEFVSGSKPNTVPEVALIMSVNNDDGNKITSDGGGDYVNGVDNVKVVFDQSGNFIFNTKASNKPTAPRVRWLNYDFSDPARSYPAPPYPYPAPDKEKGGFISTIKTNTSTTLFTPLQILPLGQTQCIGLSAGLYTIADGVVNFHRAPTEDFNDTPTAYVYVTRTGDKEKGSSNNTWTVAPVPPSTGGCSAISNVAALRVNGNLYGYGYYKMPFSFTLTQK